MITLILPLALQAAAATSASAEAGVLQPIGPQALPAKGCAAYLWNVADRGLVAMATAEAGTLRLAPGGKPIDLSRGDGSGDAALGFTATTVYRGGEISATLDMQIVRDPALTAGAKVPTGTLRIDRTGRDTLVVPVAGMIGCSAR